MADKTKTKDSEENAIRVGLAKFGFLKKSLLPQTYIPSIQQAIRMQFLFYWRY